MKSANVTLPSSPLPRVRTLTDSLVGLLVAHDEDERDLLQRELADLGVHLFVAGVEFHAQAGGFEFFLYLLGVVEVLLRDGHEADLHRREPQRKRAGVVLDEHAEEPFHLPEEARCTMTG